MIVKCFEFDKFLNPNQLKHKITENKNINLAT